MTDLQNLPVSIGCLTDGRWLAATGSAPYFCVEAGSEEAVSALAARAIRFYQKALAGLGGEMPASAPDIGSLHVKRTVSAGDLLAA